MPDARPGSVRRDEELRGTESRLAALRVLRAAHAEVRRRLRRPALHPGHRYRDLVLITRLIELELAHLSGRTIGRSDDRDEAAGSNGAAGHGGPDSTWSDPWGRASRLHLRDELKRYSAKRERLGRWLKAHERVAATTAARARYEAIALSIPWQLEDERGWALPEEPPVPEEPETPPVPAALKSAPIPPAAFEPRPTRKRRPGWVRVVALIEAGAAAVLVAIVLLDTSDPKPQVSGIPGVRAGAGSAGPDQDARRAKSRRQPAGDDRPSSRGAERERSRDGGGANQGEGGSEPAPAPTSGAVPTSTPAPAPVATTPAPPPTTPAAPAPTSVSSEPAATESPSEFGFER